MKRLLITAAMSGWVMFSAAMASEAETSAGAGSNRFSRNGTAEATACYEGDVGFARTDTHSGRVNVARGVAVGVDEDGLSLSLSQAIAPRNGPAIAGTFNVEIERDGDVSFSVGHSVAQGPIERSASAGGFAGSEHGRGATGASAGGRTDDFGRVQATTRSESFEARPRMIESRPHGVEIAAKRGGVIEPRRVIRIERDGGRIERGREREIRRW